MGADRVRVATVLTLEHPDGLVPQLAACWHDVHYRREVQVHPGRQQFPSPVLRVGLERRGAEPALTDSGGHRREPASSQRLNDSALLVDSHVEADPAGVGLCC